MSAGDAGPPWDESGAGWSLPTPPPGAEGTDAPAAPAELRYQPGALLGQGGMGRVVMARDPVLDRDVALKRVRPGASPDAAARLLREARVGAALEHPGIVPVYDAGTDADGAPWVAMRVVRGRTLEAMLADAPDGAARLGLVRRLHAIAEAVAYAHQRGVVHGDLKPANVMFGEHGEAQVLDWGLARDAPEGGGAPDPHRAPVGTPAYMSPEQAGLVDAPVDARTDVWSLGALLFELLTGRRLVTGRGDSALAELASGPPDLAALGAAPAELAAITRRCLAWRQDDRYPSAGQLALDLGRFLDGRLVEAHPYSLLDHARRFVRRRRLPLAVAALGVVALAVAVARGQDREDAQRAGLLGELAAGRAVAGDRMGAAQLALDALDLAENPKARGALAATLAGALPRLDRTLELPAGCDGLALSPDATALACRDDAVLTVYDFPALTARWRRAVGTVGGVAVTDGWVVAGPLERRDERSYPVDVLALDDGATLLAANIQTRGHPRRFGPTVAVLRGVEHLYIQRGDPPVLVVNDWCSGAVPTAVAADAAGRRLVVACPDGAVLWGEIGGPATRLALGFAADDWATACAFTADGALLVGSRAGRVWRADAAGVAETEPATLGDGPIGGFERVGEDAVVVTDNALWLWQVGTGAPERLPASERTLLGADGDAVWTSDGRHAHRWELPPPRAARIIAQAGLSALAVGDAGELVVGDGSGCLTLYAPSGRVISRACDAGQVVKTAGYLPVARVAVGERLGRERLVALDVGAGERLPDVPIPGSFARVAVMADDSLYGASYGTTVTWVKGEVARALPPLPGSAVDLAASPDRASAAVLDSTGAVTVYRDGVGRPAFVAPGARIVAPASDETVFVGADGRLERRARDGAVLATTGFRGALDDAAVDRLGRVATGHRDGTVRVWSPELTLLSELRGHRERAALVAFGQSGELWSAGWDAVIRRWDVGALEATPDALRERIEALWGAPADP